MFAPCPTFENRIRIKYHFDQSSTDWIDPISDILPIHKKFRFTYHGNISVGYYNMLYWLKRDLDHLQIETHKVLSFSNFPELRNSLGNRLLHNYVFGYAHEKYQEKPKQVELDISYKNIVTRFCQHLLFY